ncbi:hypothetical protein [Panacagrimonas sp.]|uniref:hypothetical protein n=1 Tax=Panacagrimonas sp. TaxID=2480088 RepID=UPI003B522790
MRSSELNRGAKQDEYSFEIAKQSIAAQQEDATAGRTHELDLIKWGTLRWVLAVAASIAVFLTLIVMGHVDLAKQIASHLGVTLLAGYGGFYMGKNRAKEEPRADLN